MRHEYVFVGTRIHECACPSFGLSLRDPETAVAAGAQQMTA